MHERRNEAMVVQTKKRKSRDYARDELARKALNMGIQEIQNAKIKTPTRSNNAHLITVAEECGIPFQSLYNYTRKGKKRRDPTTGRGRPSHV